LVSFTPTRNDGFMFLKKTIFSVLLIVFWGWISTFSQNFSAHADTPKRYASIVVNADTLEILHARQIDETRFPASLTKLMTLYLTFDALNAGHIGLNQKLPVSRYAAKTPPSKLGLKAGQTITVRDAIQALAVKSANDAAVVLAEALGGTEQNFANMMTHKARSLGMVNTVFKTPHGLPHPEQTSTARDMAKLAAAILNSHRRHYGYFGQTHFTYKGKTYKNTNGLLHTMEEVDGFKTGYTYASGYNLIISAQKEGRRLIAVVMGGASGKSRNQHMKDLIERGFGTMGISLSAPAKIADSAKILPAAHRQNATQIVTLRGKDNRNITVASRKTDIHLPDPSSLENWSIQVGAFSSLDTAQAQLSALEGFTTAQNRASNLNKNRAYISPASLSGRKIYRARFSGFTHAQAIEKCKHLKNLATGCLIIAPS